MHQRLGAARGEKTTRVPGIWRSVYATYAAGRDNGVLRRRVCRLLQVRPYQPPILWDNVTVYLDRVWLVNARGVPMIPNGEIVLIKAPI